MAKCWLGICWFGVKIAKLAQIREKLRKSHMLFFLWKNNSKFKVMQRCPHIYDIKQYWIKKNERNGILGEKLKNMPKITKNWEKLSWIIYVFENHLKWDRKISLWAVVISKRVWLKRFNICETLCVGRKSNWPKRTIPQKICLWHFYWHLCSII
jgi:hypothetical protein